MKQERIVYIALIMVLMLVFMSYFIVTNNYIATLEQYVDLQDECIEIQLGNLTKQEELIERMYN